MYFTHRAFQSSSRTPPNIGAKTRQSSELKFANRRNKTTPISEETVASYVDALRKIFVVEDMPAWNPNLRSKCHSFIRYALLYRPIYRCSGFGNWTKRLDKRLDKRLKYFRFSIQNTLHQRSANLCRFSRRRSLPLQR